MNILAVCGWKLGYEAWCWSGYWGLRRGGEKDADADAGAGANLDPAHKLFVRGVDEYGAIEWLPWSEVGDGWEAALSSGVG